MSYALLVLQSRRFELIAVSYVLRVSIISNIVSKKAEFYG